MTNATATRTAKGFIFTNEDGACEVTGKRAMTSTALVVILDDEAGKTLILSQHKTRAAAEKAAQGYRNTARGRDDLADWLTATVIPVEDTPAAPAPEVLEAPGGLRYRNLIPA